MVIIFFCLLIIIILLLLPVLVFKRTSRELNGNLSWGSVKNKPLIYQSEANEDTLLDAFFRMALVLIFYIISSLGIFGSLITINLLIESHYSLIAIFISIGWLSHFVLCFAWILNYRVHRFIPIIYLFTSISCAIVPIEVYWIWCLFNYIEEKEFIDVLKSSLAGMALIFPCIFIGFKISFLQLSEFEKGRH